MFLLLLVLGLLGYLYLENQIIAQRKRIMLLINENNQLKNKLNKLMADYDSYRSTDTPSLEPPDEIE
jgi:Tfp pilus assembly protein PilN